MLSAQITFKSQKTLKQLRNVGLAMKNFPAEMRSIGELTEQHFKNDVFSSKGSSIGVPYWPPRKNNKGNWPLLVKTGTMKGGWEHISDDHTVTMFNPVEYAKWHQSGTQHMPSRKIMGFGGKLKDLIMDDFVKNIEEKIRRALRIG